MKEGGRNNYGFDFWMRLKNGSRSVEIWTSIDFQKENTSLLLMNFLKQHWTESLNYTVLKLIAAE